MFLTNATIEYGSRDTYEKLSDEQKADFDQRFPTWAGGKSWFDDRILDDQDCQWLCSHGFEVKMRRLRSLTGIGGGMRYIPEAHQNASIVHVHVPNIGLFHINEVTWLEDACTQELQGQLDDGWHILAVCPPNGARRPDYILGRTKA